MFQSNLNFVRKLIDENAPLEQVIAAAAQFISIVEEYLECAELELDVAGRERWHAAFESVAFALERLNGNFPDLQLQGNVDFIRSSYRRGAPVDGILMFIGRTLDAIRAPISFKPGLETNTELAEEAMETLYAGLNIIGKISVF